MGYGPKDLCKGVAYFNTNMFLRIRAVPVFVFISSMLMDASSSI